MPGRYYSVPLRPGWRLVGLDSMDLSVRWPEDSPEYKEALQYLEQHPLGEGHPQMSTWNGGIGRKQMEWLQGVISDAQRNSERLLVALHHPMALGSAPATHLLWNHKEVMDLLVQSSSVAIVLCGKLYILPLAP
eukprot:TRINITY_DN9490_c0_g1_i3.p2 TRINITY_DN9490_c0_g1~~TRINITY_DN9490_c0_g1_i3.p2  ORF type:complete len:134 (+),score=15.03 TRINITY_DN9490_c0_g1_i3:500-901(+)